MINIPPELQRQLDMMPPLSDVIRIIESPAVDLLGDIACSPEEAKRRQASRSLRNLFNTPVGFGISSRGVKPK